MAHIQSATSLAMALYPSTLRILGDGRPSRRVAVFERTMGWRCPRPMPRWYGSSFCGAKLTPDNACGVPLDLSLSYSRGRSSGLFLESLSNPVQPRPMTGAMRAYRQSREHYL